jgi:hypothetical protein
MTVILFGTSCASPLRGCPSDIRLMAHPVPGVQTYVDVFTANNRMGNPTWSPNCLNPDFLDLRINRII